MKLCLNPLQAEHQLTSSSTGFDVRLSKDKPRETLINAYKTQGKLDTLKTLFEGKLAKEANDPTIS